MPSRLLGNLPASCFAVFEVAKPTPDLATLLSLDPAVQLSRADMEPAGFAWFLLLVPDLEQERQWLVASRALRAISQAAADGQLRELRIVFGAHLLELTESAEDVWDDRIAGTRSGLPLTSKDDGQSEGG